MLSQCWSPSSQLGTGCSVLVGPPGGSLGQFNMDTGRGTSLLKVGQDLALPLPVPQRQVLDILEGSTV